MRYTPRKGYEKPGDTDNVAGADQADFAVQDQSQSAHQKVWLESWPVRANILPGLRANTVLWLFVLLERGSDISAPRLTEDDMRALMKELDNAEPLKKDVKVIAADVSTFIACGSSI